MKKWLLTIVFGLALVLGACSGGDDTKKDDNSGGSGDSVASADAESIYKKSCASCHAADLTGNAGPNLTKVGDRLSEEEINTVINEGKGIMQPGIVGADEAEVLSAWLAEKK